MPSASISANGRLFANEPLAHGILEPDVPMAVKPHMLAMKIREAAG